jgi:hypothetical protein
MHENKWVEKVVNFLFVSIQPIRQSVGEKNETQARRKTLVVGVGVSEAIF